MNEHTLYGVSMTRIAKCSPLVLCRLGYEIMLPGLKIARGHVGLSKSHDSCGMYLRGNRCRVSPHELPKTGRSFAPGIN